MSKHVHKQDDDFEQEPAQPTGHPQRFDVGRVALGLGLGLTTVATGGIGVPGNAMRWPDGAAMTWPDGNYMLWP